MAEWVGSVRLVDTSWYCDSGLACHQAGSRRTIIIGRGFGDESLDLFGEAWCTSMSRRHCY